MENNLLLKLDLQFFADPFEDIDIDAIDEQILGEEQNEEIVDEVDTDELDLEIEEDSDGETDVDSEIEEQQEDDSVAPDISTDDGRDAAFAEMRRENQRLAAEAAFIRRFAEENGMSVEELQQQYEEQRLQKEAEAKGVPVEVMKRLSTLEQETEQAKAEAQAARFNAEVQATLTKYSGTQDDFNAVIQYVQQNGMTDSLRNGTVSFEAAYKLANMDTMIEKAKRDAVQSDLATRKKRQQEAPIVAGNTNIAAALEDDIDALAERDAKEALEQMGF